MNFRPHAQAADSLAVRAPPGILEPRESPTLSTDLANPTSNSIDRAPGFEALTDRCPDVLLPAATPGGRA